MIQNFDSSVFLATGFGAFIPSKKHFKVSVLSQGNVIGSADYTDVQALSSNFFVPLASGGALPLVVLDAMKSNAISLKLTGGLRLLRGRVLHLRFH